MTVFRKLLVALCCLCLAGIPAFAQVTEENAPVTAKLLSETGRIVPGQTVSLGVLLKMAPGWHTYFKEPGDSGMPTTIQWELPAGFRVGEIQWPKPIQETEPGGLKVNVYKQEVLLMVPLTAPPSITDPQVKIGAKVEWLACKESCIPGQAQVSLSLPVLSPGAPAPSQPGQAELFQKYRTQSVSQAPAQPLSLGIGEKQAGFWRYLLFAFIGGLILNVMPCVLPVISLKILGFLQHGNESPARVRTLGWLYALGVFCSFLLLAGFVLAAQQAGNLAGWGMQFQSPVFVVAITVLVTLVSLNLFGLFEVTLGSSALTSVSGLASRDGTAGAFFNGVFAVILATPCTAPFLGAALGFAFLQPAPIVILFFLTIALGLALPYVLLCSFPGLIKFLPKPGAWMEYFKIAMGFPMLATAVWLFTVATRHYAGKSLWLGLFLIILALAAWIYGEFVQRGRKHKRIALGLALLLVIGGYSFALENRLHWRNPEPVSATTPREDRAGIQWQAWTPEAVDAARAQGHPVLVDFTADWCLTCQTNQITSLEIPSVQEFLKNERFVALLGDYTRKDDAISRELKKFGRAGVPLVVVYPVQGDPVVLPELLTPSAVLEALRKAKK